VNPEQKRIVDGADIAKEVDVFLKLAEKQFAFAAADVCFDVFFFEVQVFEGQVALVENIIVFFFIIRQNFSANFASLQVEPDVNAPAGFEYVHHDDEVDFVFAFFVFADELVAAEEFGEQTQRVVFEVEVVVG
jgi:hypothetical protein